MGKFLLKYSTTPKSNISFRPNDETALFTLPASEVDTLEDAVLVDCFLGNNLTHHEEKLTYSRGYKAAKNVADLLNFVIINDTYNFANMQIKTITETSHTESPTYNAKTIYTLTSAGGKQKFYYVPLPGKTVQTVQPKKDQERFFYMV